MPDHRPTAHTLTLDFGRLLTPAEWYAVISRVRQLPFVTTIRVDAVCQCGDQATTNTTKRPTTI